MFTKFQLYLLAGCIVAAAAIFAICEFQQRVPPQQSIPSVSDSLSDTANAQHLPSIADVTNGTLKADTEQKTSLPVDRADSSNDNLIDVIPASDYHDLKQAMTNFFSTLDSIEKQITTTQDANGTVRLIESWTAANNNLAMAMGTFEKKHPQISTPETVPPELLDMFNRFKEMNQKYASISEGLRELAERFKGDSKIAAANEELRQSLEYFRQ